MMREELQRTFNEYFEQFEKTEEVNTKLKRLVLENIGLQDELFPILEQFQAIAKKQNYTYSIALGYAMWFYLYYTRDLDKAIVYNEKARELFMQIPGYENMEGILTVANNAVLVEILKENYGGAYMEILKAMPMAEKNGRITYYSAFLNNGAIILAEFGLYKKAIQQVEETLQKHDIIGDSNYIVTIFLLMNLCISAKEVKKAKEILKEYAPYLQQSELFNLQIFNKFSVEIAMLEENREEAKRCFEVLQKTYSFEDNDLLDNAEVYLVYARYYLFMEDFEKAEIYYQIVYDNFNNLLGNKLRIREEMSFLKAKQGQYKEAYKHLNEARIRSHQYVRFIDDMYRHELEDVWQKNRMLSYEVLYQRLLDITSFGKIVTSSLTRNQLIDVIKERLPQIFKFDICRLLLYDEQKTEFKSLDNTIFSSQNSLLQKCVDERQSITYSNILEGDSTCIDLGELYQKNLRSVLLQPITYQNNLLAVIYFGSFQINFFSQTDQSLLQVFADYVAIALQNIYRFEEALVKASFDYLTGTYNRSALMQQGESMLLKAKENHQSIGALMIDIDDFKVINDTYGHIQGDEVIRKVTQIMDKYKQHGIIARFGGEEFILLINDITIEQLYQIAEQIRYECESCLLHIGDKDIHFTISIGCCFRENIFESLKDIFEEADQRLYIAKRNGKNYVQM